MTSFLWVRMISHCGLVAAVIIGIGQIGAGQSYGQTSGGGTGTGSGGLGFGTLTPFVTSVIPIIGPNGGVVGGVSIDPEGVVLRAELDLSRELGRARAESIGKVTGDARRASRMRKISLRKLDQEIVRLRKSNLPLSKEIELLGGLQRIEYVFVDPQNKDIILAGPAEGWHVGQSGFVVGDSTGHCVIELSDLLIALRSEQDESEKGISCSMDATDEGLKNYNDYMRKSKPQFNRQTLQNMRQAIGNFEVTFSGVDTSSHYARVLIAADLMMKRLAMNLEPSPVRGITSYIQLLKKSRKRVPQNAMPRWWLAVDYEPLLRDETGLAWKIRGPAVKAMTDQDFLNQDGEKTYAGTGNPLAQQWADDFTKHYAKLSIELPVFGQLRNCMDLAVVAALLNKYELFEKAEFNPGLLLNADKIRLAKYDVPKFTPPQISYAPKGRSWIVTLSGGIDIDGWSVASKTKVDTKLSSIRKTAVESGASRWWWD